MTRRQTLFAALLMTITLHMAVPARAQAVAEAPMSSAGCEATSGGLSSACDSAVAPEAGGTSPEPDATVLLLAAAAVIAMRLMRGRRHDAA